MVDFYTLSAPKPNGSSYDFASLKGKVVLIVNTASKCGFTPQFAELEELNKKYKDQGLVILGFPCNQFASQDPEGDEGIGAFCTKNYGVSFDMLAKSDVNGSNANEVFKWLKDQKSGLLGLSGIKWNFTKFLVDKDGKVQQRYSPQTKPLSISNEIEKLLKAPSAAK
ncbi:putative GPX2-glutathione peroxidase [Microstroma glucosiphilum]|uniref:Glutathione peroxidase n=1 Tax=Pseudomicrostroma glucosiphilum TaxID=1684307 RepID=A0A316U5J4_9BASI|nr:putative GPX2-glutathione peroxidase [Pseudomicrostroma glucosiphilum]PWN20470.1 putative GPX2-glutathione peroxidase [Pseudomicrostroma glucosiphilum]